MIRRYNVDDYNFILGIINSNRHLNLFEVMDKILMERPYFNSNTLKNMIKRLGGYGDISRCSFMLVDDQCFKGDDYMPEVIYSDELKFYKMDETFL